MVFTMSWQRGTFTSVDNMEGLRLSLGSYYKLFSSPEHQSTPVVSAPFVDYSGLGKCIQFYLLPNKVLARMKTAKMTMMTSVTLRQNCLNSETALLVNRVMSM